MISAERLVKEAIEKYHMPKNDTEILVGFSGGSDSVCLLSILYDMGYNVTACHLNHNMRETASRDMLFCEEFCRQRDIPFVSKIAEKDSIKNEAEAREARYSFFKETMQSCGIAVLATAHNKNDSAETVLLNLLRGASLDGLCGISPIDGTVIRPLISVSKKEVLEYIDAKKLQYMTDETNLTDKYTRNKIRNRIIPVLEEFNPKLVDNIAKNAELMSCDREYLRNISREYFEKLFDGAGIPCEKLNVLPRAISGRVLEILWQRTTGNGQNLSNKYIEKLFELSKIAKTQSKINLPQGVTARVEYGVLSLAKSCEAADFLKEIEIGSYTLLENIGIKVGVFEEGDGLLITLDGTEKLFVRKRQTGDFFIPSGMNGRKSVSDYFTDRKVPYAKRDKTPILTADGAVVAVGDMRADNAFSKGKRKNVYYFRVLEI